MTDELLHLWCPHCHESLCGLTADDGHGPLAEEVGSSDEGLDCIVCADLAWARSRKSQSRCMRVVTA